MNGPPARKARVQTIIETYLRVVAEIVRQGQKEGGYPRLAWKQTPWQWLFSA